MFNSIVKKILERLSPGIILSIIGIKILGEDVIFLNVLIGLVVVYLFLLSYRLVKFLVSRFVYYPLKKNDLVSNLVNNLKLNSFPDPSLYDLNFDENIVGEIYFREVSNDKSLEGDIRFLAVEYKSAIETMRSTGSYNNLFTFLKLYKDSIINYKKDYE
jgi:hypothetical protein